MAKHEVLAATGNDIGPAAVGNDRYAALVANICRIIGIGLCAPSIDAPKRIFGVRFYHHSGHLPLGVMEKCRKTNSARLLRSVNLRRIHRVSVIPLFRKIPASRATSAIGSLASWSLFQWDSILPSSWPKEFASRPRGKFHTCNDEVSPVSAKQIYLVKIHEVGFSRLERRPLGRSIRRGTGKCRSPHFASLCLHEGGILASPTCQSFTPRRCRELRGSGNPSRTGSFASFINVLSGKPSLGVFITLRVTAGADRQVEIAGWVGTTWARLPMPIRWATRDWVRRRPSSRLRSLVAQTVGPGNFTIERAWKSFARKQGANCILMISLKTHV